jgi:hypothetical protein
MQRLAHRRQLGVTLVVLRSMGFVESFGWFLARHRKKGEGRDG